MQQDRVFESSVDSVFRFLYHSHAAASLTTHPERTRDQLTCKVFGVVVEGHTFIFLVGLLVLRLVLYSRTRTPCSMLCAVLSDV